MYIKHVTLKRARNFVCAIVWPKRKRTLSFVSETTTTTTTTTTTMAESDWDSDDAEEAKKEYRGLLVSPDGTTTIIYRRGNTLISEVLAVDLITTVRPRPNSYFGDYMKSRKVTEAEMKQFIGFVDDVGMLVHKKKHLWESQIYGDVYFEGVDPDTGDCASLSDALLAKLTSGTGRTVN
jgi:hypothetical protein